MNAWFTSAGLRRWRHALASLPRKLFGRPPTLHYFHQVDDPYAHLLLQALPKLLAQYRVQLQMHLVSAPADSAAPDRARLQDWSRRDAVEIAVSPGLTFVDRQAQPSAETIAAANAALLNAINTTENVDTLLGKALAISERCWANDAFALRQIGAASESETRTALRKGDRLRQRRGHYLGGMLYFEGEWYWGIDRLHHLEARLQTLGFAMSNALQYPAPSLALPPVAPPTGERPVLHFFCSLRSPYTYLAVARCAQLAQHYGAELRLRFVLPMVMRGLPVPREKRMYIVLDTKREAESLGLPFGRIADPVGLPTERGLALLHRAIGLGKGVELLQSFMQAVWSEGVDAGTDEGLQLIATRCGLDSRFVADALADDSWRAVAQANREEMLAAGLWGVPSFRVNDGPARWGQDRLYLVERDLMAATKAGDNRPAMNNPSEEKR